MIINSNIEQWRQKTEKGSCSRWRGACLPFGSIRMARQKAIPFFSAFLHFLGGAVRLGPETLAAALRRPVLVPTGAQREWIRSERDRWRTKGEEACHIGLAGAPAGPDLVRSTTLLRLTLLRLGSADDVVVALVIRCRCDGCWCRCRCCCCCCCCAPLVRRQLLPFASPPPLETKFSFQRLGRLLQLANRTLFFHPHIQPIPASGGGSQQGS